MRNSFVLYFVLIKLIGVNSILIINATVKFCHSYKLSALLYEEFRSPVSHISEALDNKSFAFDSGLNSKILCNFGMIEDLLGSIEDSQTSGLSPATDATNAFSLARSDSI